MRVKPLSVPGMFKGAMYILPGYAPNTNLLHYFDQAPHMYVHYVVHLSLLLPLLLLLWHSTRILSCDFLIPAQLLCQLLARWLHDNQECPTHPI